MVDPYLASRQFERMIFQGNPARTPPRIPVRPTKKGGLLATIEYNPKTREEKITHYKQEPNETKEV